MSNLKKNKIKSLLDQVLANIQKDRTMASSLLTDVAAYIGEKQERHGEVGLTAAKYLETLSRNNEQIVKIVDLINDIKDDEYGELDSTEKDSIYSEFEKIPEKLPELDKKELEELETELIEEN